MTNLRSLKIILGMMLIVLARGAEAFCLNPAVWPETVGVETVGGNTNLIFGPAVSGGMDPVHVTVSGFGVVVEGQSFSGCNVGIPPPSRTQTIPLGVLLAPGLYQLRVVHNGFFGGPSTVQRTGVAVCALRSRSG